MVQKSNGGSITEASPRRARRRDARRDGILRAAAQTFRTHGFAEAGMRDIALAADLSPANLYHYFRGKDEILFYCQDRALDRMLRAVAAARRTPDEPAPARLRAILRTHLHTLLDDVEGATAHVQVDALPPPLRARIVTKRDRYERAIRRLIEAGVASGDFVTTDAALSTRALLGALNWTVTWFRPGGPQSAREVGEAISVFVLRGLSAAS